MPLLDPEFVREQIPLSDPAEDEVLVNAVDEVEELWKRATGRPWVLTTGEVLIYTPSSMREHRLYLPLTPVSAITLIEERERDETDWTTLAATKYILHDATNGIVDKPKTTWGHYVRVTYNGGHTPATLPKDIRHALITQIRFWKERLKPSAIATRGMSSKGGAATFLEKADEHHVFRTAVKRHRRIY